MVQKNKLDDFKTHRLEKLQNAWKQAEGKIYGFDTSEKLTVLDLRLLLESSSSVSDLIRDIVALELNSRFTAQQSKTGTEITEPVIYTKAQQDVEPAFEHSQNELIKTKTELAQAKNDLKQWQQAAEQTKGNLQKYSTEIEKLRKREEHYQQEIKTLKNECKQLQAELETTQSRTNVPPELAFLRSDLQLAHALGLNDLPTDDTQALIQTVAVLAQIDNIKHLWEVLKDRCEVEKRHATVDEHALLHAALTWHNHNWRTRPYRLIDAAAASAYNYESHQRSRHTNTGETISTQHLPGIADGSGRTLCKALVSTR